MIENHHGRWAGENLLWLEAGEPLRSAGAITISAQQVEIDWSFKGKPHHGVMKLSAEGTKASCHWVDSWHMEAGMDLVGTWSEGLLNVRGTYPAGDGPDWGWRIEVDLRSPELAVLRMYNIWPSGREDDAVLLEGRVG